MFKIPARTLRRPAIVRGLGLHHGEPSTVTLSPGCSGWTLQGRPVHVDQASAPGGCTVLHGVSTVEHLFAAVLAAGITDLDVQVEGRELPALDGSAQPWFEALDEPVQTGGTWAWGPEQVVEVEGLGGTARFEPAEQLILDVDVEFPGLQQHLVTSDLTGVLAARTFLPHSRLDALAAAGLGRGATPGNVVVWGPRGGLVPLRMADEPVRHKALDLLGDLALVGCFLRGRVKVRRGSHALHQLLVRALLERAPPPPRSG